MYLLYRGTEKLTSVHTALYRYIQPVIAGILAITRGQAHFDAANITASVFIFAGVILVVVGYKYYVSLRTSPPASSCWKSVRLFVPTRSQVVVTRTGSCILTCPR